MTREFFRMMAERCRELIERARNPTTKTQLKLWAEEFDAQAERSTSTTNSVCAGDRRELRDD
jgi:hypothetical protein